MKIRPAITPEKLKNQIVIIEDHPLYGLALKHLLSTMLPQLNSTVVNSVEAAIVLLKQRSNIKLIVMDIHLPELNGIDAILSIKRLRPHCRIVLISGHENHGDIPELLNAGADLFISKSVDPDDMLDKIIQVLNHTEMPGNWVSSTRQRHHLEKRSSQLTTRQREILFCLQMGYTNKAIAEHLHLAEITIKQHISTLFKILGASNRTQAVRIATQLGLINHQKSKVPDS